MDVLSQILKVVRLDEAVFHDAEYLAPFCHRSPASHSPDGKHLIRFHLVSEGRGSVWLDEGGRAPFSASDLVIVPHGDPHTMESGCHGEITRLVCGSLACEPRLARIVLAGLPPLFKVNLRDSAAGGWLEESLRFALFYQGAARAGGAAVLAKLSEVLLIEMLRHYLAGLPDAHTGWLAGARDPDVGRALATLHRHPARPWTVAGLAKQVGVSRSVLTERFTHFLGAPPMSYLTRWRLQLGAQRLSSTRDSVAQIAFEVGYESEPAFNRAFKRVFGVPPGRFRAQSKSERTASLR